MSHDAALHSDTTRLTWQEAGATRAAAWRSEAAHAAPKRIALVDDTTRADQAFRLASEGTGLLWRGDFQNARQLLAAMARRTDRKAPRLAANAAESFRFYRQAQAQRARTLGMVLLQIEQDHAIRLRRAPDVRQALFEAVGPVSEPYVMSMRELLGMVGAHEWRKTGIALPGLSGRIHPHYGVFAPLRQEYVQLVAQAPLQAVPLAFDIGCGTGVLAAILAQRGVAHIVATDIDARALACAADNLTRLELHQRVELLCCDLFPSGRAPLVVCNPPWIPARPSAPLERAIYDPESRMLKGFLAGLKDHLTENGEGWLVLSDLAEHLQLRSREQLLAMFSQASLEVQGRIDLRAQHGKAKDPNDALYAARAAEVTSLWRLRVA